MVDLYNAMAQNQGLLPEEMRAVCLDILVPRPPEDSPFEGQRFDLIVVRRTSYRFERFSDVPYSDHQCASAYHHFESIEAVTTALVSYLKPGGALMVVDLIRPSEEEVNNIDEIFPEHDASIVCHRGGFKEEEIISAFNAAGLQNVCFEAAIPVRKKGYNLKLFLAKGERN